MIDELRQRLQALQKTTGIDQAPGALPLGIAEVDDALGGGLARGALHEIAAAGEAHLAAATGFALAVLSLGSDVHSSPLPWGEVGARSAPGEGLRTIVSHLPPHPHPLPPGERESGSIRRAAEKTNRFLLWIAEDMALNESGAPYGPGLDTFTLAPERLLTVAVGHRRDLMWAMEEALRCRAVGAVIGEVRHGALDAVGVRRLSLAATQSGALALLLRASPVERRFDRRHPLDRGDRAVGAVQWI